MPDETAIVKFAEEHIEPILRGEKWMTLRLDFDYPLLARGDHIVMFPAEGEHSFAMSTIKMVRRITIRRFVQAGFDGHRKYESVDEAVEHLQGYYPERDISGGSVADVPVWDPDDLSVHPDYQNRV